MIFGAHVGVSGGYPQAVEYAVSVGCECMQVFAKSPRRWQSRPVAPDVAASFQQRVAETGIRAVMVHTAYLINLGTDDKALWERSWRALADELERAEILGAQFLVTHLGTRGTIERDSAAKRIARAIQLSWDVSGVRRVRLLLENTAGAGITYGHSPEELGCVYRLLGNHARHVGMCLDTCHAHAAGWDLSGRDTWDALLDALEEAGAPPIEAVHANDCLHAAGQRKDRHAWIGEGTIGCAGFQAMVCEPRLRGLPAVVEMPGPVPEKDVENITRLKRLRDGCAEGGYSGV